MFNITIHERVALFEPVMVAAWPGMGSVGVGATDYRRRSLRARRFAEIDTFRSFTPEAITVRKGLATLPPPPRNLLYFLKNPDIIIFQAEAQISGQEGVELMQTILAFAQDMKVQTIYTAAAFPLPQSYRDPPEVYGAVNDRELRASLRQYGVKPMDDGQISGMNGLLLGFAQKKNLKAACLLATIPHYAISLVNPRASKAIVEMLAGITGLTVPMQEIDSSIKRIEKSLAAVEERVREILPATQTEERPETLKEEKVPDYVLRRIEKLFQEAQADRQKAYYLKEELDRWSLYDLYEDRFLDLFREKQ